MRQRTLPYVLTVTALFALAACAGNGEHARKRTTFDVVIEAVGDRASLASDHGATIELTEARIALGSIEWFEGDALFAQRVDGARVNGREIASSTQRVVDRVLSFSAARAHPGHYTPGEALADLVDVGVVDLLAGPLHAGTAEGLTGPYGTVSLPFTNAAALDGHAVKLAGIAHCDDGDVPFSIALALDKVVEGVPSAIDVVGDVAGDGTVTISVSLEELVRRIDFDALAGFEHATAVDLMSVEQGHNAVARSVESQATYSVHYEE